MKCPICGSQYECSGRSCSYKREDWAIVDTSSASLGGESDYNRTTVTVGSSAVTVLIENAFFNDFETTIPLDVIIDLLTRSGHI